MATITGNLNESLAITDWRCTAIKCKDGTVSGTSISTGATYSITCVDTDICDVTISQRIDKQWAASLGLVQDEYIVPSNIETTPKLYKATTVPAGDANYANVSLRLHCDGSDLSTTFTDTSPTVKTITPQAGTTISTAQSKFGGASGIFTGNGMTVPSHADFAYGTGDFTWDMWVDGTSASHTSGTFYLLDHGANGGVLQYAGNKLKYYNSTTGVGSALYTSSITIAANTWTHVRACRVSGVTYLFTDGTLRVSAADTHNYVAQACYPGRYGAGGSGWVGYMDEITIYKGVGLSTTNFTPPTSAYIDAAGTSTSGTEPTWPSSGTVAEGSITYTYIADLVDPTSIGPKKPV